ncbi:MAG: hypothetical protein N2C13_00710 [Chloroflexota bacterium]
MKRYRCMMVFVIFALSSACGPNAEPGPSGENGGDATPTNTPLPTSTRIPIPSVTPDLFRNAVLRIVGDEEVVFDWTTDRCASMHIPDLPVRAFRNAAGQVLLTISHTTGRLAVGPDLNTLTFDCTPINISHHQADPAMFSDNEWIAAPYTEDGITVYALVHNEYQGHVHPGQCPSGDYFSCWYNTVTLAVSHDGGLSFELAAEAPDHLVASMPNVYEPDSGPYGMFSPSNIIQHEDGYYYSFLKAQQVDTQEQWACLMRTDNLADPASWRYWDGSGFDGQFVNPYTTEIAQPSANTCKALDPNGTAAAIMIESVTYNTYLERYVLVGISADHIDGREVWGCDYSCSHDLIHWTRRKLLVEMPLPWTVAHHTNTNYLYPALLDPESISMNFDTTGKTAYLYYTRNNFGHGSLDRDLIRVQVEFFASATEAP